MAHTTGSAPASKIIAGTMLALAILSVLPVATSLPLQGTFDGSWYLSTVPPSTIAITNGVLETRQSNPNATGYTTSYYDTAQIGSFPWQGQPTTQPIPYNTINITLQFHDRTLQAGSRYQIYLGLYYYLPNGTIQGCNTTLDNQGCHTYQWFDTEARLAENINGTDTTPGTENTYDAHNSFGYDTVLAQLQPGQQGNLTSFNIETQFQNAATNWNIDKATPHQLMGVEVGTAGYSFQTLNVDWYTVQLANTTQSPSPSPIPSPTPQPPPPTPQTPPSTSQPAEQSGTCLPCQAANYVQTHLWLVFIGVLAGFTIPLAIQLVGRRTRPSRTKKTIMRLHALQRLSVSVHD
ncbi:MAG: hypothetical protein AUJ07_05025 [Crenarchaeota archaeon 13_1_40CM_3_53_5]|nr:MAG: hypothetical protein AUJ07_05025 [Crenarchaeota archaeon 13_1_40CM_3_53_5]